MKLDHFCRIIFLVCCLFWTCAWADKSAEEPGSAAQLTSVVVLCYHQMNNPDTPYSVTTAQFEEQMQVLADLYYVSISPEQYVQWLSGNSTGLPARAVLITFDDNLASMLPAVNITKGRRFTPTMFVVTGFVGYVGHLTWAQIADLKAQGWHIQLHAGAKGHFVYQTDQPNCDAYYACRSTLQESVADYEARVTTDVNQGLAELRSRHLLEKNASVSMAIPFDNWGQSNPDTVPREFLPGFLVTHFQVLFDQDWGYSPGFNRRYRFEVHSDTTIDAFTSALDDPRFGSPQLPTPTKPGQFDLDNRSASTSEPAVAATFESGGPFLSEISPRGNSNDSPAVNIVAITIGSAAMLAIVVAVVVVVRRVRARPRREHLALISAVEEDAALEEMFNEEPRH